MKRMFLAALAAAAALVPDAMAQDRGREGGGERGHWFRPAQPSGQRWSRGQQQLPQPQGDHGEWRGPDQTDAHPNRPNGFQDGAQAAPAAPQPVPQRNWLGGRSWDGQAGAPDARPARPDYRGEGERGPDWNRRDIRPQRDWAPRPGWNRWRGDGGWSNGWRGDRRYDWRAYREYNRSLYRLPRYYPPYGWGYGYRRFSIGIRLNSILFGPQFWISDPYYYRLPEVWGTYRWVRYYDDALLVDIETGQVVDVIYGIFW